MTLTTHDAIRQVAAALSQNITSILKHLLETKHLYQSVSVGFDDNTLKITVSKVSGLQVPLVEMETRKLYHGLWHPWQIGHEWKGPLYKKMPEGSAMLCFRTPHVKLFCRRCDRIEAFNFVSGEDVLEANPGCGENSSGNKTAIQIFVFSFLCQSCKCVPEVFLIRREGGKLTLGGRSPIEHVEVPRVIPKAIAQFFSGAVVAHQSGQTLAGVFLFRVLIEQWAQSQAQTGGLRANQVLDEYMDALPTDFKERFPSLRTLYEKLSVAIHKAEGPTDLFDEAQQQIIEHFEAQRLFKLTKNKGALSKAGK